MRYSDNPTDSLVLSLRAHPFCHNVQERGKLAALPVLSVNAVADRDKADAMLTEESFRVKSGLQIITTDGGFWRDRADISYRPA